MRSRPKLTPGAIRRAVFDRDQRCCMCGGAVAFYDAHIHHRKLKAQGGRDEMANLILLDDGCHFRVHHKPRASYRHGFLVPSWAPVEAWPVLRFSAYWEQPGEVWTPSAPAEGQLDIPDFQEGA